MTRRLPADRLRARLWLLLHRGPDPWPRTGLADR
jgi:hypothetical protein